MLGLLFDGPEYSDWEEIARFDVTFDGLAANETFTLRTNYLGPNASNSTWDGSAIAWVPASVVNGGAGWWSNADPFAGRAITRLDMYAAYSSSCYQDNQCSDQSDYVFRSMGLTTVPEPGTLALLALGLAALCVVRARDLNSRLRPRAAIV